MLLLNYFKNRTLDVDKIIKQVGTLQERQSLLTAPTADLLHDRSHSHAIHNLQVSFSFEVNTTTTVEFH